MVKHCLAVFDLVFLLDPSFKSTFAQNKSCSSYRSLQLLFWLNFTFQCKNRSFGWSKSAKNHSISVNGDSPVLVSSPSSSTFASPRVGRRRSSLSAQTCRRVLIPFPGAVSVFPPLLLPHARGSSRARAEPSPATAPAISRRSARFPRTPSRSTSPSIPSARFRARLSQP